MGRRSATDREANRVSLDVSGAHFNSLRAYAIAQGLTVNQAARELLLASLAANATDGAYQFAAMKAYGDTRKIAQAALATEMRNVWHALDAARREEASINILAMPEPEILPETA
jgi:hypothetical protein